MHVSLHVCLHVLAHVVGVEEREVGIGGPQRVILRKRAEEQLSQHSTVQAVLRVELAVVVAPSN